MMSETKTGVVMLDIDTYDRMNKELEAYRAAVVVTKESWRNEPSINVDLTPWKQNIEEQFEGKSFASEFEPIDWTRPQVAELYSCTTRKPPEPVDLSNVQPCADAGEEKGASDEG